jgi:hypothetical protein
MASLSMVFPHVAWPQTAKFRMSADAYSFIDNCALESETGSSESGCFKGNPLARQQNFAIFQIEPARGAPSIAPFVAPP